MENGFEQAMPIKGGFDAWQAAGYQVEAE